MFDIFLLRFSFAGCYFVLQFLDVLLLSGAAFALIFAYPGESMYFLEGD
jgi:hypothetical protein